MNIVIDDYKFASTTVPSAYHPFASAGDCESPGCSSAHRSGSFQVDISGTNFRLPQSIQYNFNNYPPCTVKLFDPTMDESRQRWSAKCGGHCGRCTPTPIHLELIQN